MSIAYPSDGEPEKLPFPDPVHAKKCAARAEPGGPETAWIVTMEPGFAQNGSVETGRRSQ
jgi:hypothetical protein